MLPSTRATVMVRAAVEVLMITLHSHQKAWSHGCSSNKRFEEAMMVGNQEQAAKYNSRRVLLVDFHQYLTGANEEQREMAQDMLHTIDDLSDHENSPSADIDEPRDTRRWRLQE